MAGARRNTTVNFISIVLFSLQTQARPDKDVILHAALHLRKFQELWRGINAPRSAGSLTLAQIDEVNKQGHLASLMISESLKTNIYAKLHRV